MILKNVVEDRFRPKIYATKLIYRRLWSIYLYSID